MRPRSAAEVGRPDADTIQIARDSCAAVADRPAALAESFYAHLFDMVPEVRGMFPADMSMQNERMSRALVEAVRGADDPAAVERLLQRMGAAHSRNHSVIPEHYPHVGRALVRAVRDLSPRWSPHVASAWVQVYEWMAAHMVIGAENSTAHTQTLPVIRDNGFSGGYGGAYGEGLPPTVANERERALSPWR